MSVRSPSAEATTGALSTLIITNLAYAVTTLSLGFKEKPELSLYECVGSSSYSMFAHGYSAAISALIVLYLLSLSWVAVFFALPQYNRFKHANSIVKVLAIGQSYFLIAFGYTVLSAAPSFGNIATCNNTIVVSIFAPFKLLNSGRTLFLVALSLATVGYTLLLINDYRNARPAGTNATVQADDGDSTRVMDSSSSVQMGSLSSRTPSTTTSKSHHPPPSNLTISGSQRVAVKVDGRIVVTIILILTFSVLAIVNTELLRTYNKTESQDGSWGFGQVRTKIPGYLPIGCTDV